MSHPVPTQDITEQMLPDDNMSFDEAVREVFVKDVYDYEKIDYTNFFK